jgi:hypothetical protein
MMSNKVETLGMYIRKIFDTNKDGVITFKDFLGLFPNNAIAIAVIFVDLVVLVAEYRVFDVGMKITNNDWLKAIGFVLVSAVPFYIGQIFWLYPRAGGMQKTIAVGMVIGGLYTSAVFGLADLSLNYDVAVLVGLVVRLTVAYIVAVLWYILVDEGISAHRAKAQARAAAELERELQILTRDMLNEWKQTQELEKETIDLFGGDEQAVIAQLNALRGKKGKKEQNQQLRPVYQQNSPAPQPQAQHTLAELSDKSGMTAGQMRAKFVDYDQFAAFASGQFDYISGKNMHRLFNEVNPTKPSSK